MKNKIVGTLAASLLVLFTVPASADSLLQTWSCKLHDGKTRNDITQVSAAWLKAAMGMEGGKGMKVWLDFPLAGDNEDGKFNFVLEVADTKAWGTFMNSYDSSPAAKVDQEFGKVASCSGGSLWNSIEVK